MPINYTYTFHGVLASTTFDVVGGDDVKRGLKIQVVKEPEHRNVARPPYPTTWSAATRPFP